MRKYAIDSEQAQSLMTGLENEGKTAMLIAIDGTFAGVVAVADTVKETSKEAIKRMRQLG